MPCCCRQAEEACQSQAVVGCPGLQEVAELYCHCQVVMESHHCCQVVVTCRYLQVAGSCRGRQAVGQPCCCQVAEACRSRLKAGECRGCRLVEGLCCARLVEVCGCQTAVGACRRSLQEAKGAAPLHSHPFAAGTGCAVAVDCASQRLEVVCGRGSSGWVGGWLIWRHGENCLLRFEGCWAMRQSGQYQLELEALYRLTRGCLGSTPPACCLRHSSCSRSCEAPCRCSRYAPRSKGADCGPVRRQQR